MALLHAHSECEGISVFLEEVLLHGALDTLKLIPILFLTYLLMEFIEHKGGDGAEKFMKKAGVFAPIPAALLGMIPQCGFSASASNLFAGRIISIGTVIAVFLSTSDEMLPILIAGELPIGSIILILLYKALVAMAIGLLVDFLMKLLSREKEKINIDAICDEDNCHCERGIIYSATHHTLTITLFVLIVTIAINALIFFVGEENIGAILYDKPFISHIIAAVFGLIPNCAASVALATLFSDGFITVGTMMSGLFSGAGVGLLVLFRVNRHIKENLIIIGAVLLTGIVFGLIGDLIFPSEIFLGI